MPKKIYFAKGKRSKVYLAFCNKKKVVLKEFENRKWVDNEAKWLKILNKYNVGPKFIKKEKNILVYEFVPGERIIEWLKKNNKKEIKGMLKKIFLQCRILDKLKVSKEELQNPYKHILIAKEPKMIDFEKCKKTDKPKNVTQFCQFLMSHKISRVLKEKRISINKKELIKLLRQYKKTYLEKDFKKIIAMI